MRAQDDDVWDFKSSSTSLTTTASGERVYTLRDDVVIFTHHVTGSGLLHDQLFQSRG